MEWILLWLSIVMLFIAIIFMIKTFVRGFIEIKKAELGEIHIPTIWIDSEESYESKIILPLNPVSMKKMRRFKNLIDRYKQIPGVLWT